MEAGSWNLYYARRLNTLNSPLVRQELEMFQTCFRHVIDFVIKNSPDSEGTTESYSYDVKDGPVDSCWKVSRLLFIYINDSVFIKRARWKYKLSFKPFIFRKMNMHEKLHSLCVHTHPLIHDVLYVETFFRIHWVIEKNSLEPALRRKNRPSIVVWRKANATTRKKAHSVAAFPPTAPTPVDSPPPPRSFHDQIPARRYGWATGRRTSTEYPRSPGAVAVVGPSRPNYRCALYDLITNVPNETRVDERNGINLSL